MPIDPLLKPVLATFITEAETIRQRMTRSLIELERATTEPESREAYADLRRGLHTLKGTAATFGLNELSKLAHRMEDLATQERGDDGRLPGVVGDALLRGLDAFIGTLDAHAKESAKAPDISDALGAIERALGGSGAEPPSAPLESRTASDDIAGWRVSAKHVSLLSAEIERLRELRLRLEESALHLSELLASKDTRSADLSGPLIAIAAALRIESETAQEVVSGLEDGLKLLCTVPVSSVLEPLHRLVRDDCRRTGKRASLSIVGGELSLDRRLLEALRGALVHLVRNAVDHGIEAPEVRDRAGKNAEGAIGLRFELQGNLLAIEVSDDGSGLDTSLIGEEAVRRGMVDRARLATMDRQALFHLIFEPGFSTRSELTETSGRGAGLDAVHTTLQELHGYVDVLSEHGQGTRFVLTLPTGIGSSPVLVVSVAEHRIGIPLAAVESVVMARSDNVEVTNTRTRLKNGSHSIPVRDLGALLGLRQAQPPWPKQPLCVVHAHAQRAAIAVDSVQGDRDLAIRPLPSELRRLAPYQGAGTLASGDALLVIRPDWLVEQQHREVSRARRCLVVDDSIAARAMHRTVLESAGFVVHTAASAEEALEKLRSATYDAVVCDLQMSKMDGFELVRGLRASARLKSLPVIVVSVSEDDATERQARDAGADAFVTKRDCVAGRLIAEVESAIARGAARA